ncbi:hypothetical protein [Streptomyces sp. ODS28]|uniref:hypothetical protein n=1 Tax=Streptomyces sp. ODS28 TaxID=3136688 RepID=UPI0031E92547
MIATKRESAAVMAGQCSADEMTAGMVLFGLRRSLTREAVTDELYDDLDAGLGEGARPAADEVAAIADRLRTATTALVQIVPHLVVPYPVDEIRRVINLSSSAAGTRPGPRASRPFRPGHPRAPRPDGGCRRMTRSIAPLRGRRNGRGSSRAPDRATVGCVAFGLLLLLLISTTLVADEVPWSR